VINGHIVFFIEKSICNFLPLDGGDFNNVLNIVIKRPEL